MKTNKFAFLIGCLAAAVLSVNTYNIASDHTVALVTPKQLAISHPLLVNDATSNSVSLGSIFRFKANVENKEQKCLESSNIILNNLSWRVKLCKYEQFLSVFLVSSLGKDNTSWTVEAESKLKLLPKVSTSTYIAQNLPKHTYTKANPTFGVTKFTNWDSFLKNYVKENEAVFEIKISEGHVTYEEPKDIEQIYIRQHIVLENVSKLTETKSAVVVVRGIKWRVHITKNSNGFLALYLEADENDLDIGYYYLVEGSFKLLSFDKDVASINYKLNQNYRWGSSHLGSDMFLDWATFLNKAFVTHDKANLLVQFEVSEPKSIWDINEIGRK